MNLETREATRKELGAGRASIPTGLRPSAQGWSGATTLGRRFKKIFNPNGVVAALLRLWTQPLQGCIGLSRLPRVARSSQPWADRRNPFGIGRSNTLAGCIVFSATVALIFC